MLYRPRANRIHARVKYLIFWPASAILIIKYFISAKHWSQLCGVKRTNATCDLKPNSLKTRRHKQWPPGHAIILLDRLLTLPRTLSTCSLLRWECALWKHLIRSYWVCIFNMFHSFESTRGRYIAFFASVHSSQIPAKSHSFGTRY